MPDDQRRRNTAEKQISDVVRSMFFVAALSMAGCVLFVFMVKNFGGKGRISGGETYKWVGEWIVPGQECNGPRYRIRSMNYAAPSESLTELKVRPVRSNTAATFTLNDGVQIDIVLEDLNRLSLKSSAGENLTLVRCLNPFRTKRAEVD